MGWSPPLPLVEKKNRGSFPVLAPERAPESALRINAEGGCPTARTQPLLFCWAATLGCHRIGTHCSCRAAALGCHQTGQRGGCPTWRTALGEKKNRWSFPVLAPEKAPESAPPNNCRGCVPACTAASSSL